MAGGIGTCLFSLGLFCNISFFFVAQNTQTCELMSGKVINNLRKGESVTHFFFPSGVSCDGGSYVTYTPPLGGCAGQRGKVWTTCSDGRKINGDFMVTSSSCKLGYGTAADDKGNDYDFTFGYNAKQATEKVNLRRRQMGCPLIDVDGVEMRVQGKLLRTE